ncbi:MAG TPA: hypothetical protein VFG76_03635 [Candidatus Polarisedimenticolia bacterium]|nr:hypothetical protein [Candidatus Polarisedimenticolia bacterium]
MMCCLALLLVAAAGTASGADEATRLVLSRLDRVASLYRDAALRFSCEERIILARPDRPTRFLDFEYIYEFSEANGLLDYRVDTRVPHRSGKQPRPALLSDYDLPYSVTRGYSWIFLFERAHQERYRYSLGHETTVLGRPASPIAFEPLQPIDQDVNDWFGTLWVDAESLQPLRVEAMKWDQWASEQAFKAALAATDPIRDAAQVEWVFARVETEFTHVENAMRFPGRVISTGTLGKIRMRDGKRVPDERTLFTVTQLYDNYRFFGVRAEETIREIGRTNEK